MLVQQYSIRQFCDLIRRVLNGKNEFLVTRSVCLFFLERKSKKAESNLKRLVSGAREDYKRNSLRQQQDQQGQGDVQMRPLRMSKEVFRESAVLVGNAMAAINLRLDKQFNKKKLDGYYIIS